jgi:hypothetical protein
MSITAAQAKAFRARWSFVNAAERDELRLTSMTTKAHQLASLMASVDQMGWTGLLAEDEAVARARWAMLRSHFPRT